MSRETHPSLAAAARVPARRVFAVFLRLGLTSFGGPVAHLGYFRAEAVHRRAWLDERTYADLVALCQFLPGPASSQVGLGIGLLTAGPLGALAAWTGFTLPSALAMTLFALGLAEWGAALGQGWLHGLKIVAVAVVAQAVWGMGRSLAPDRARATIALAAAVFLLAWPVPAGQILAIAGGALAGLLALPRPHADAQTAPLAGRSRAGAVAALVLFAALLAGLPVLAGLVPLHGLALADSFYRAGSLVFGGGHVVLPLLQSEVVPPGWVSRDVFLAGYGAAQAVPGPLFTFAAFLGAAGEPAPNGWAGAAIALLAIFAPSFLLVFGVLPFWDRWRGIVAVRRALDGVNAAVVGLLLAALYNPVITAAIAAPIDVAYALAAFALLTLWRAPPWAVVLLAAAAGLALPALGG